LGEEAIRQFFRIRRQKFPLQLKTVIDVWGLKFDPAARGNWSGESQGRIEQTGGPAGEQFTQVLMAPLDVDQMAGPDDTQLNPDTLVMILPSSKNTEPGRFHEAPVQLQPEIVGRLVDIPRVLGKRNGLIHSGVSVLGLPVVNDRVGTPVL